MPRRSAAAAGAARRLLAAAALLAIGVPRSEAQQSGGGDAVVCEPRIVAACVLGTFAGCAVAAALVAVYLFLRRRSRRRRRLGVMDRLAKSPFKSHANGAFATESSDSIAFTFGQMDDAGRGDQRKGSQSKQCSGKNHRQDNGIVRKTLDDASQPPQKCVAVDLHSKDFGGLGLDISSSYTEGVFVTGLQELGPAKASGKIDIGDRIVSITVSFENIVYDDAAAILSRASPYHVRFHVLKKPGQEERRTVGSGAENGGLANGLPGDGGSLQHPAFARSQSLSTSTAITGKLFHESLLCHESANCQHPPAISIDPYATSDSAASDPLDGLPVAKAKRSATIVSKTSVTALPGTVRLDTLQAERVIALVHGSSPPRSRNGRTGDGDASLAGGSDRAGGWSKHGRRHDTQQPGLAPNDGGIRWGSGSHHSSTESISSNSSGSSAAIASVPAPQEAVTVTVSAQLQQHKGDWPPPVDLNPHATPAASAIELQGSTDLHQGRIVADGELQIHVDEHSFESRPENSSAAAVVPPPSVAAVASVGWPDAGGLATSAGASPSTPVMAAHGRTTARLESVPDATDGRAQRPRHLPTAVMELMQKKEAASVVLDQLEAFATMSRNNNNSEPRYAGQSDDLKAQHLANGSVTIGVIHTPEDESSILAAVLSAAKLTDDGNTSGDEELKAHSNMPGHDRSAHFGAEGEMALEAHKHDDTSDTTAASEIKVLAAKLCSKDGTLRRPANPTIGAPIAEVTPDQRSIEEARALHFSTMLRSAKKS